MYNGGTITNAMYADFTNNYVNQTGTDKYSYAMGGAIYNSGTINGINGDFTGNYVTSKGTNTDTYYAAQGGAIANYKYGYSGTVSLGNITGNFTDNTVTGAKEVYCGAISNYAYGTSTTASIGTISGIFTSNEANYGGAIYNYAENLGSATIAAINNSIFTGNRATALGGAIYNGSLSSDASSYSANAQITLSGSTFTGNYVDNDGTITPNSIYNAGVINIADGATVTINDGWQSHNQAQLKMLGSSSVLNMNIGNGTIQQDSLGVIANVGTINATVDLDLSDVSNSISDTITVASVTQEGFINLTGLKLKGTFDDYKAHPFIQRILINSNGSSDLQLKLAMATSGDKYVLQQGEKTAHSDEFDGTAKWTDTYETYNLSTDIIGTIEVTDSGVAGGTTNDSIGFTVTGTQENKSDFQPLGDTLKLANQYICTADRTFSASSATETYTVTDDVGTTSAGSVLVKGVANGDTRSTLDFDGYTGFVLDNADTTLTLKDVEVTGANGLVSSTTPAANVKLVLDNVNLDGTNGGITTFGDIDIKGNSTISDDITVTNSTVDVDGTDEVTLDSAMTGAGSTLNIHDGKVNLTNNAQIAAFDLTLQDVDLNLANETALSGLNTTFNGANNLNMANGSVGTLALSNVNLNGVLTMQVDADLANKQMDKLSATTATVGAGGAIQVDKINLLSSTTEEQLSLLFTNNSNLADAVSYTGDGTIVYSPIFKYKTSYSVKNGEGYFDFVLPSNPGPGPAPSPSPSDFNPAVLSTPTMSQAGMMANMNATMNYASNIQTDLQN